MYISVGYICSHRVFCMDHMRSRDKMRIRSYRSSDAKAMAELFYETVHTVNRADYTKEQAVAWAPRERDLEAWDRSFREHYTCVAEEAGQIIGFGDMAPSGYLDRLYVHKEHQREGVGSQICDRLEQWKAFPRITVHASITARLFFEKRGYRVLTSQTVERSGVKMVNFVMEKKLEYDGKGY